MSKRPVKKGYQYKRLTSYVKDRLATPPPIVPLSQILPLLSDEMRPKVKAVMGKNLKVKAIRQDGWGAYSSALPDEYRQVGFIYAVRRPDKNLKVTPYGTGADTVITTWKDAEAQGSSSYGAPYGAYPEKIAAYVCRPGNYLMFLWVINGTKERQGHKVHMLGIQAAGIQRTPAYALQALHGYARGHMVRNNVSAHYYRMYHVHDKDYETNKEKFYKRT